MPSTTLVSLAAASALILSNSVANGATATFGSGTNIRGKVTVESGELTISLDLSDFNTSLLPNGTSCYKNGLYYHIHEKWIYPNTTDELSSDCGAEYTGSHWDPWTACSSSTGNEYCQGKGSGNVTGCVPPSVSWKSGRLGYSCDETNYTTNPYVCEVGDWSGKYGIAQVDEKLKIDITASSAFEVDSIDLEGKSIVFHCTDEDSSRAFCAPFTDTDNSDSATDRDTQSGSKSKKATFEELEDSYVELLKDNTYEVNIDISNLEIPQECGELLYRVYTASPSSARIVNGTRRRRMQGPPPIGNNSNSSTAVIIETTNEYLYTSTEEPLIPTTTTSSSSINCSEVVNAFYDPTVSCAPDSQYQQRYCSTEGFKCGDDTYYYNCNKTADKYSCAPGDLSGKYGVLDTQNGTITNFQISGFDELMISLDDIDGLYVVLQCSYDPNTILTCGQFGDYSGGGKSNNNNNKNNGLEWWVILLIVIGCLLVVGGAVYAIIQCRKTEGGSYSQIDGKVQEK